MFNDAKLNCIIATTVTEHADELMPKIKLGSRLIRGVVVPSQLKSMNVVKDVPSSVPMGKNKANLLKLLEACPSLPCIFISPQNSSTSSSSIAPSSSLSYFVLSCLVFASPSLLSVREWFNLSLTVGMRNKADHRLINGEEEFRLELLWLMDTKRRWMYRDWECGQGWAVEFDLIESSSSWTRIKLRPWVLVWYYSTSGGRTQWRLFVCTYISTSYPDMPIFDWMDVISVTETFHG